eukprot:15450224-Alexandrium_andersonii.AAC.1
MSPCRSRIDRSFRRGRHPESSPGTRRTRRTRPAKRAKWALWAERQALVRRSRHTDVINATVSLSRAQPC